MTPKYDLKHMQSLVKAGDLDKIWFSAPSRSVYEVIRVFKETDNPKDYEASIDFILKGLLALTEDDFVKISPQWDNEFADVYGLVFENLPWFVKFILKDEELEEISFHPPKEQMKTVSGKVIPPEEKKNG